MEPVRYALIGCGDMGQVHALNYLQKPGLVDTVAVCDISDDRLGAVLRLFPASRDRVRVVHDYRAVLDMADVEAVVVSTPNHTHCEIAEDAFAAGKHVFCEKPMEVSVSRCRRMITAWQRSGKVLQIGLVYRYSPLFRRMAELIRAGAIGEPLIAWCQEFREPFPIGRAREWRYSEALSGGALVEKDCHHFDLFNWFLGSRPARVQAMGGQLAIRGAGRGRFDPGVSGEPYAAALVPNAEILDHAWANIEYENGAKANLGLCLFAPENDLPFGVLGTTGRLATRTTDQRIELMQYDRVTAKHRRETIDANVAVHGFGQIGHSGGFDQHVEFCRCIREGVQPFCDGWIGIESLYPAFAAQQSIAEGGRVIDLAELRSEFVSPAPH